MYLPPEMVAPMVDAVHVHLLAANGPVSDAVDSVAGGATDAMSGIVGTVTKLVGSLLGLLGL